MSPEVFGLVALALVVSLSLIGMPVALAIISVAAGGMYISVGDAFLLTTFRTLVWSTASNYAFAVVPMFVLMGEVAGGTRIIADLYTACYRWLSGMRSGVYSATVLASAGFAALSGSTVVNAAVFTRIALPEIERLGYNKGFGAGCIAAAGALAAMIPPSLAMVLYGLLTGESIGALLIAGVLPGLLTAAALLICVIVMVRLRPGLGSQVVETFTWREKAAALRTVWPAMLLAGFVIGAIYSGLVSPSAAGTVGAAGAILIALLNGRLTWPILMGALRRTVLVTGALFLIVIGGLLLSRMLVMSGSVSGLTDFFTTSDLSAVHFLALVMLSYFVMGMLIDPVAMMVLTIPFLYPTAIDLGIDPIWFGIIIIKLVEIAAITPPIGINLFAILAAAEGRVEAREVLRGVAPFVVVELVVLALLVAFPSISTALPGLMFQ